MPLKDHITVCGLLASAIGLVFLSLVIAGLVCSSDSACENRVKPITALIGMIMVGVVVSFLVFLYRSIVTLWEHFWNTALEKAKGELLEGTGGSSTSNV